MNLLTILVSTVFVNNYVFARFLGICPFLGVSQKTETATGMGLAVTFVITMASAITYFVQHAILDPLGIGYLQTLTFILIIASLVQFIELFIKKASPALYDAMGVYLPLITTNCVVLAVTIINIQEKFTFVESIANGLGASLGFFLALLLLAGVREKLELANVPKALQGVPIALVAAGLMSIAFSGFSGIV
ncbi:MAG: electron transport complex subunit RsxA [Tissierellaceae bacterium]|jgi:electron transport complex protein RnfA|nr:electron transport complex subunit RsxA [Tissierellia bacterium]